MRLSRNVDFGKEVSELNEPRRNTVIGSRIRDLRESMGKTIAEMADDTGLGDSALRNYEIGLRIPNDAAKLTIARYFGKTVDELFYCV
jgi:transcriptional regulator with XRE-family HTH domain